MQRLLAVLEVFLHVVVFLQVVGLVFLQLAIISCFNRKFVLTLQIYFFFVEKIKKHQ
jgi:hypothetical protein